MTSQSNSVTVSIYGGLGNQLFQYAVGRSLAIRNRCELLLDRRHYLAHRSFSFGLHHFNIKARDGSAAELPPNREQKFKYTWWRLFSAAKTMVRERGLEFDSTVLDRKGALYLRGYWQSEKYFQCCEATIRRELSFRQPPTGANAQLCEQLLSTNSIGIHIRRGDYIKDPRVNKVHGTCPLAYYRAGVDYILRKTGKQHTAFVFSDDPDWARQNVQLDCRVVIVDQNDGHAAHEDLRLLASCEHQVISNSTFSWWAAWLNDNSSKIVVAPLHWFADPKMRNDDLVPSQWQRIDVGADSLTKTA